MFKAGSPDLGPGRAKPDRRARCLVSVPSSLRCDPRAQAGSGLPNSGLFVTLVCTLELDNTKLPSGNQLLKVWAEVGRFGEIALQFSPGRVLTVTFSCLVWCQSPPALQNPFPNPSSSPARKLLTQPSNPRSNAPFCSLPNSSA